MRTREGGGGGGEKDGRVRGEEIADEDMKYIQEVGRLTERHGGGGRRVGERRETERRQKHTHTQWMGEKAGAAASLPVGAACSSRTTPPPSDAVRRLARGQRVQPSFAP